MFIEERHEAILRTLHEHGKVKVRDLSEKFQVTDDCIRKDLKVLENAGCLKRTYGGAILSQDYPLDRDVVDRRPFFWIFPPQTLNWQNFWWKNTGGWLLSAI